ALSPPAPEIGFIHRHLADGDLYFLANTAPIARSVRARFAATTSVVESWDPMSGTRETRPAIDGGVLLSFEPYASRIIVARAHTVSRAAVAPRHETTLVEELRGGWTIRLGSTADARPVDLPHS